MIIVSDYEFMLRLLKQISFESLNISVNFIVQLSKIRISFKFITNTQYLFPRALPRQRDSVFILLQLDLAEFLRVVLKPPERSLVKLIREFALDFTDLSSARVVTQSACHLLVGHGFAVALALAPHLGELLFVL